MSSRSRRLARSLLLAFAFALTACPTPMHHALRASNGLNANVAVTAMVPSGRHGVCGLGCRESGDLSIAPSVAAAVGYGHVFGDMIGIHGGLYALAMGNGQTLEEIGSVGTYSFLTVQNRSFSAGAGPELNATGISLTIGGEYRDPDPHRVFIPAIGVYSRWFVPFSRTGGRWYSARVPTVEFGIRGRLRPFFAQYAYYANMEDRMEIPLLVEGSVFAEGFHVRVGRFVRWRVRRTSSRSARIARHRSLRSDRTDHQRGGAVATNRDARTDERSRIFPARSRTPSGGSWNWEVTPVMYRAAGPVP